MSENPPPYNPSEKLKELPDAPRTKILKREMEEGRFFTEAEGGGKESVETIVECDGTEHTQTKERITYNNQGGMTKVEELEKTVLGPCTCADGHSGSSDALSQAA